MIKEMLYAHATVVSDLSIGYSDARGNESKLIAYALSWLSWITGALAVAYIIYSGILYITSAGNAEQAKKGRQGLLYAIIGIVISTLILVIIRLIRRTVTNGF